MSSPCNTSIHVKKLALTKMSRRELRHKIDEFLSAENVSDWPGYQKLCFVIRLEALSAQISSLKWGQINQENPTNPQVSGFLINFM